MNRTLAPILVVLLAFLCGCGSTHKKLDRPREEIAELHGISPEFKILGTERTLLFTSLDGVAFEKSWGAPHPDALDVLPGKHRVGIWYSIRFDGNYGPSGDIEAEIDAQAGKVYRAELLHAEARGWYVEFRETERAPEKAASTEAGPG